ncbi:hypothetical protein KC326_g158 [Hortaea werneckii]|nr:hypothetical protein KC326_g158 [Hortaea werneckii]
MLWGSDHAISTHARVKLCRRIGRFGHMYLIYSAEFQYSAVQSISIYFSTVQCSPVQFSSVQFSLGMFIAVVVIGTIQKVGGGGWGEEGFNEKLELVIIAR